MISPDYDQLLQSFVDRFKHLPQQRSSEWLQAKSKAVGGSELAILDGCNPYQSLIGLIMSKSGVYVPPRGNLTPCHWGTLFEDVITRIIEIDLNASVMGTDIWIPSFPHHNVSPDGYCTITVVETDDDYELLTSANAAQHEGKPSKKIATLVEFKCPIRRRPNGEVPQYYKPQVWAGLHISPMASQGLFVDAVFRKTPLKFLRPNRCYDFKFHREKNSWGTPIALGIIGFYSNDEALTAKLAKLSTRDCVLDVFDDSDDDQDDENKSDTNQLAYDPGLIPIDLGDTDNNAFEAFLHEFAERNLLVRFNDPHFDGIINASSEICALNKMSPEGYNLIGILPWKLFDLYYVLLDRNFEFMKQIEPVVQDIIGTVLSIREAPNPTKKFKELYPDIEIPDS